MAPLQHPEPEEGVGQPEGAVAGATTTPGPALTIVTWWVVSSAVVQQGLPGLHCGVVAHGSAAGESAKTRACNMQACEQGCWRQQTQ